MAVLRKGEKVFTGNVDQSNLLNSQFQSGFSISLPLNLAKICHSKVSKYAKSWNRYNQVPHLTQNTNMKVTNSQLYHKREPRVQPFPSR